MANQTEILFEIDGLEEDRGNVRLAVFRDKVNRLATALLESERQVSGKRSTSGHFRIHKLSHESPATIGVEPYSKGADDVAVQAATVFAGLIDCIATGREPPKETRSRLFTALKELADGEGQKFRKQRILVAQQTYEFGAKAASTLAQYLSKQYVVETEIKGRIERVNIHDRHDFYLYPEFGEGSVKCHFEEELISLVGDALGKSVLVHGRAVFVGGDIEPSELYVQRLDLGPVDYEVPPLSAFLGQAHDATGNEDTHEFIRKLRDEWGRH